jgi:protein-disulfide isomerase
VLEHNSNTVKIVFKHYPLGFHKMARPAALAGIAAANQGKFWGFHDLLYENFKTLSEEQFITFAQQLELDIDKFKHDMKNPATKQILQKDILEAQKAEVTGTPTIFINGHRVQQRSLDKIQKMIDAELK